MVDFNSEDEKYKQFKEYIDKREEGVFMSSLGTFDGGYGWMNLNVLRRIYVLEEQSPEQRINYENQLKKENLESFTEFLNWKNATENHIENIKDVLLKGDSPIINNEYID